MQQHVRAGRVCGCQHRVARRSPNVRRRSRGRWSVARVAARRVRGGPHLRHDRPHVHQWARSATRHRQRRASTSASSARRWPRAARRSVPRCGPASTRTCGATSRNQARGEILDEDMQHATFTADSAILSYRHYELWGNTERCSRSASRSATAPRSMKSRARCVRFSRAVHSQWKRAVALAAIGRANFGSSRGALSIWFRQLLARDFRSRWSYRGRA